VPIAVVHTATAAAVGSAVADNWKVADSVLMAQSVVPAELRKVELVLMVCSAAPVGHSAVAAHLVALVLDSVATVWSAQATVRSAARAVRFEQQRSPW